MILDLVHPVVLFGERLGLTFVERFMGGFCFFSNLLECLTKQKRNDSLLPIGPRTRYACCLQVPKYYHDEERLYIIPTSSKHEANMLDNMWNK